MASQSTVSSPPSATRTSGTPSNASSATTFNQQDGNVKNNHAQFCMQTLLKHIRRASDYAAEFVDIDKALQERDEAIRKNEIRKRQLFEKDRVIKDLQIANSVSLRHYEARYEEWICERKDVMEKSEEEKNAMLKTNASEMAQLQTKLAEWKARSESLESDAQLMTAKLNVATQELAQWKQYTSGIRPMDRQQLTSRIDELFRKFYNTIQDQIPKDLSPEIAKNRGAWSSGIKQLGVRHVPFEVTCLDTELARMMRVAFAMHIAATELIQEVFKPWYIPDSTRQSMALQQIMGSHADAEPKKSQLMRALLLSTKPPEEIANIIQNRSLAALEAAVDKLSFMSSDNGATLRNSLETVFIESAELWKDIEYWEEDVQIIDCDDSETPNWPWTYLDGFGPPLPLERPPKKLLLFPGFYLPNDNSVLHEGFTLFTDQKCVVDAEMESRAIQASRAERPSRSSSGLSPTTKRLSVSFGKTRSPPLFGETTSSPQEMKFADVNGTVRNGVGLGLSTGGIGDQNNTVT